MQKVIIRDRYGNIDLDLFRHTTFAVLKYSIASITNPKETAAAYECTFSLRDNQLNERLTPNEAKQIIDGCDMERVIKNEYGIIWDHRDRRFYNKHSKL